MTHDEIQAAISIFEQAVACRLQTFNILRKRGLTPSPRGGKVATEKEIAVVLALDTALAALRECEERAKGCEWCTPEPNECLELPCSRLGRTPHADYETAGRVDGSALFCPMCGRDMREVTK